MKTQFLTDFFRKIVSFMPWNRWRRYNSAATTPSQSGESLAEWLARVGKKRGIWSEITYFTCMKTLAETLGKIPWNVFRTTPKGTIGPDDTARKLVWTIPVRKGQKVRLTMYGGASAFELTSVKGQFIYFGVVEKKGNE